MKFNYFHEVPSDRQLVELFHFSFLERLVRQTSASLYALALLEPGR